MKKNISLQTTAYRNLGKEGDRNILKSVVMGVVRLRGFAESWSRYFKLDEYMVCGYLNKVVKRDRILLTAALGLHAKTGYSTGAWEIMAPIYVLL